MDDNVYREYRAKLITDKREKIQCKVVTCGDIHSVIDYVKDIAREHGLKGNIIHVEVERGVKWQK